MAAVPPAATVALVALDVSAKVGAITVSAMRAVRVRPPPVPVSVRV